MADMERTKNMERTKFCICCVLILVSNFVIAGGEILQSRNKNCTYAITIETLCMKGAETSDHISLRFGDANSNDILVRHLNTKHVMQLDPRHPNDNLDDMPVIPFQACTVDQFQATGQCIHSRICYLYLKVSGNDDWRPGFAQVRPVEAPHFSSKLFYFRRYLPRRVWHGRDMCDTEVTPFGIKYKRKVFTTKNKNAHSSLLP